ncbi:MAG: hypothetical protein A2268_08425 [Candidatus Raymondbacteria bacterium RifOxyA12_full_50_37]|uniref:Chemotaxis phosphatase CheX-like domain-containing protein n=1 Tax=Candidatus Raymondbacteria bacterium RIFOXYD12_FULL_49_13 TaxID=1817890 RepID=A0A1F7F450_UNCRA|nr:MAG: hypothetical protein A2268_08425 [Candidatus Raymondbacteria bacterium RifOxyA12_full_50_37]OGJ90358.1 MAG: hypothetical protein A2248_17360 [Candidatus Raymondbacteria bacterium RIFOXYA2_FULL_49_16]OGK01307.1 MAG: hypothetical protein A2519_12955 [Candidatus Raymondbacteria bacterium RIFOXYD12_FULL_49_13]OGP43257.1 MAG: hypothetical protein A2324_08190 [Candidatus Raymondbacteria bacterium RIFOXYB2_FULL_49_35]
MHIALVNLSKAYEGMVRNAVKEQHMVTVINATRLTQQALEPTPIQRPIAPLTRADGPIPEERIRAVRAYLQALLSNPDSETVLVKQGQRPAPARLPDLVLYYPADAGVTALGEVAALRRALGFRDIPIAVCAESAKQAFAATLMSVGANAVVTLPCAPQPLCESFEGVMRTAGGAMPVITKLINPFINAVTDLMGTMAGMTVQRKELFLKKNYRLFGDVSGVMRLSGAIEGSVAVSFTEELARLIVGRIMRLDASAISSEDLQDGVGEIVNIVSGNAKALLAGTEYECTIALPGVVSGMWVELGHPGNAPCVAVVFEADNREFALQVSVVKAG